MDIAWQHGMAVYGEGMARNSPARHVVIFFKFLYEVPCFHKEVRREILDWVKLHKNKENFLLAATEMGGLSIAEALIGSFQIIIPQDVEFTNGN